MEKKVTMIPAKPNRIVKNAGIYCRVSTNKSDQLNSLTSQVSALTRVISKMEQWELTDTFIGIASAKEDNPRKEFERILQVAENHQISVVITKSMSRFGRDMVDTLEALKRLRAAGVTVHFTQEGLDTADMSNDLLISVVGAVVQA